MKKHLRNLFCAVLSIFLLTVFVLSPASAMVVSAPRMVISANLVEVLETAASNELIPVDIWITEIDSDAVEQAALKETGLNKAVIAELYAAGVQLSSKEIDAYIEAERRIYAERQLAASEAFLQNMTGISSINTPAVQRNTYVSKYAPVISTELTKTEIQKIAKSAAVTSINYVPAVEVMDFEGTASQNSTTDSFITLQQAFSALRIPYVRDTLGYTGNGIKIGQFEEGIPDCTASHLIGADITYQVDDDRYYRNHATDVAGIMVSQDPTNKGIVPDAKLYCAIMENTHTTTIYDHRENIEWLLDQGVHIINMSAGYSKQHGTYADLYDGWFDHLAIQHSVHFVAAVGNKYDDPDIYIAHPAMAYNVIAVGSANVNMTGASTTERYSEAQILSANFPVADKPDIIAPGENITLFCEAGSGTSYAAPMVTAIAAQMMEANPMLKTCQDSLKACLMASINNSNVRYVPSQVSSSFNAWNPNCYSTCGAGLVDAQSAVYTARAGRFTVNQYFSAGASVGTMKESTFTVSGTDSVMRVALTWLKSSKINGSSHVNTEPSLDNYVNMELRVYDPNGNLVGSSIVNYGNVQIVQFSPTMTGTYTVKVKLNHSPMDKTYFSVAWW